MRRKLTRGLARSARRAALVSTLGFVLALAVGVGGFFVTAPSGVSARAVTTTPQPAAAPEASTPGALAAITRRAADEAAAASAISVIPVRERALAASRQGATPASPAPPASAPLAAKPPVSTSEPSGIVAATAFSGPIAPGEKAPAAATHTPRLVPGERIDVSVSFYYCQRGTGASGDGGGFCGAMRDGNVVYDGAAACDVAYLGQIFKIHGDPLQRVYKCADTGSAVHGLHRDIWFNSSDDGWGWQRLMGQSATIEILP